MKAKGFVVGQKTGFTVGQKGVTTRGVRLGFGERDCMMFI